MNNDTINNVAGVARAALLATLNIGLYSGRKKDSRTQAEVIKDKQSGSARAASVYKSLFADCPELDAIVKFQARARKRHYMLTLPWNDNGARLLPGTALMAYQAEMRTHEQEYAQLCQAFLDKYDTLVGAAAFQLGTLFDRSEYPTRDKVSQQFHFTVSYDPVPTSGDFRVDVESDVQRDLKAQYEARMADQLAAAQADAWSRAYEALERFRDRLTLNEDGTRRVFQETMVSNAQELCMMLTHLNVTKDPKLEEARKQMEQMLTGVDVKELRKEEGARLEVLHATNKILDAFDWGTTSNDTN